MKAAILHAPRELRVEASRTPEPGEGDALVRVAVAGLCGTDYSIFSGDRRVSYPRVMGHEFVGRVEAGGGGGAKPRVGDRGGSGAHSSVRRVTPHPRGTPNI